MATGINTFDAALTAAWEKKAGDCYLAGMSKADQDDVHSEALMFCLEHRAQYDSAKGTAEGWYANAVKYAAMHARRDKGREKKRRLSGHMGDERVVNNWTPERDYEVNAVITALETALRAKAPGRKKRTGSRIQPKAPQNSPAAG